MVKWTTTVAKVMARLEAPMVAPRSRMLFDEHLALIESRDVDRILGSHSARRNYS